MMRQLCQRLLLAAVRLYQLVLSPLLPPACRFEPSCSAYALEAIRGHGPWRGSWLALCRLGRCHPFCPGGYDPVPPPPGSAPCCCGPSPAPRLTGRLGLGPTIATTEPS